MRILALEPYYGGSHRNFLDAWATRSRHCWHVLSLPPHHWKWRMRHAAITFARDVAKLHEAGKVWDLLFCSDMLNLAEFRALAPPTIGRLPAVCYFHENQLTYPDPYTSERDRHFAMTNFISALAADAVWFNSAFHRDEFLQALQKWLRAMPEDRCLAEVAQLAAVASEQSPGIEVGAPRQDRAPGPIRIVWAARWEHDKGPEAFFEALSRLKSAGHDFRVSVVGQSFDRAPSIFASARVALAEHIAHWGYMENRSDYLQVLRQSDLFVSTAVHEFFGLSACEAMGQGAIPVLPRRLAYPELLQLQANPSHEVFFYDWHGRRIEPAAGTLGAGVPWRQCAYVCRRVRSAVHVAI